MAVSWAFSDGTTLELGGKVSGAGRLADELRSDASDAKAGRPSPVMLWPEPEGIVQLDLNDVPIVDAWARREARRAKVEVVSAPEFDPPPNPRGPIDVEPGTVL